MKVRLTRCKTLSCRKLIFSRKDYCKRCSLPPVMPGKDSWLASARTEKNRADLSG